MDLVKQFKDAPDYIVGFAESRIGGRTENQDSFGNSDTPFGYVVTVCDGMGGGPGGRTASSIAVAEIIRGIKEGNPDDTAQNVVIKAILCANRAIISKGQETPALQGMGSTCTVLLINEDEAIVAHVGDSRVYQLRGKSKVFRTFDHSMVFDLVKQKVITEEQARLSAQSNIITRALGIKSDIDIDIAVLPFLSGDRFLLCTDGIHGVVPEDELISMATDKRHALGTAVDSIATSIDEMGRCGGGGHDNLTLAIVETKTNSKRKPKMDRRSKLILAAMLLVCVVSLIFNCIQCSRTAQPDNGQQADEQKALVDSMNVVVHRQDSLLDAIVKDYPGVKSIIDSFSNQTQK